MSETFSPSYIIIRQLTYLRLSARICIKLLLFLNLLSCSLFVRKQAGVVSFHDTVPSHCQTSRGIKQKKVIPVHSEKQLREHYGLTFEVRFQDGKSPRLYGSLYYQNPKKNLYCMALPNGRFATFSDSAIGHKRNLIQELCYPLQECEGY